MRPFVRAALLFVATTGFAVATGGCASRAGVTRPDAPGLSNLGQVDAGLWRSAQPTPEGFRSAEKLGVKTVVNLRAEHSDAGGLGGTGLQGVSIPMRQWSVSEDDLCAFLVVATDPGRRPVLVHCAEGRDRTGACVAAYRMVVQGWNHEDARREMRSFGAMPWFPNLDRLLRHLDVGAMKARVAARAPLDDRPRRPPRSAPARGRDPRDPFDPLTGIRRLAGPMRPTDPVRLTPGKRVLFLTKDPERIRAQLAGTLNLTMDDVKVEDLLDDINTDAMTPAWVCFRHRPEDLALDAYAGLVVDGQAPLPDARADGRQLRGDRLRPAQGHGLVARDGRAGREVVGHPHRDRGVVRADPRAQQHQLGRADGRPRDAAAPAAGRGRPARGVHEGLRPRHASS